MPAYDFSIISVFNDPVQGFTGNTAAVVMLQKEWNEEEMQQLAEDLNQPATSFLIPTEEEDHYKVRWFAPDAEIGLCGHGSMAAIAFLRGEKKRKGFITLHFLNGEIAGEVLDDKNGSLLFDNLATFSEASVPEGLQEAIGVPVQAYYKTSNKDIVILEHERLVKDMTPDFFLLKKLEPFGYMVTAPGATVDFVSRTLVPHVQQLEDPATGSSHTILAPFWAKKLNKSHLTAHQLSKRGGKFECLVNNDQVRLNGRFSVLAEGKIRK